MCVCTDRGKSNGRVPIRQGRIGSGVSQSWRCRYDGQASPTQEDNCFFESGKLHREPAGENMGFSGFSFSSLTNTVPHSSGQPGTTKRSRYGHEMSKSKSVRPKQEHPGCSEALSQARKCPCDRVSDPFCYYSPNGHLRMSVLDEVFGDGRGELGCPSRPTYEGLIDG